MKNRLLSFVLAVLMVFSVLPVWAMADDDVMFVTTSAPIVGAEESQALFGDVQNRYYEENALFWAEKGILEGDGKGNFNGEGTASRAELAKIICETFGFKPDPEALEKLYSDFDDIVKGAWYVDYIAVLYAKGIMLGNGARKMYPNAPVSRQEAFTLVGRSSGLEDNAGALAASDFKGADSVASWAKGAVGAMIAFDVIHGDTNGNLNAQSNMKRGELVTFMSNLISDFVDEGGNVDLQGKKGIVIIKTTEPVTLSGDYEGNVVISESSEGGRQIVDSNVDGKVIISANDAETTLNGTTAMIQADADAVALTVNDFSSFIQINGDNCKTTITGDIYELSVIGDENKIKISSGNLLIADIQGSKTSFDTVGITEELYIGENAEETSVNVQIGGEIKTLVADGTGSTLSGAGIIGNAVVNGSDTAINTLSTNYTVAPDAQNVTSAGQNVASGSEGKTEGTRPTVIGGNTTGAVPDVEVALDPVFASHPQSIDTVRLAADKAKFSVEVQEENNHSYFYQWYINDSPSVDGAQMISGATSKDLVLPKQYEECTKYVFCHVTATRTGALNKPEADSEIASFTVVKDTINVLLLGGFPDLALSRNSDYLLKDLFDDYGIEATVKRVFTSDNSNGIRPDQMFTWSGSGVSVAMTGDATSGSYKNYVETFRQEIAPDNAVKYDYVVWSISKTWSLISSQRSFIEREGKAIEYVESLLYEQNPDAELIVAATAGYFYDEVFGFTSSDALKGASQADIKYTLANNRADHVSKLNVRAGVLRSRLNGNDVSLDNSVCRIGDAMEVVIGNGANPYSSPTYPQYLNEIGAYVVAGTLFSHITKTGADDFTITAWEGRSINAEDLPLIIDAVNESVTGSKSEYKLIFDTVGGDAMDPVTAEKGSALTAPAAPQKANSDFGGWFLENTYETPYVFDEDSKMPIGGFTLYAKWVELN